MIRKKKVRLAALKLGSTTGGRGRLRRHISVKSRGRWIDVGAVLLREGLALWFPNANEWAWNRTYSQLAAEAAQKGIGIWDTASCGAGPSQASGLEMKVKWDANGTDNKNISGEWARITNNDPFNAISLRGWWFRDSHLPRYNFPNAASIPAGGSVQVRPGGARSTRTDFYWDVGEPIFENASGDKRAMGDGGYLFDPQGDLRAWVQYPCPVGCADPVEGNVSFQAHMQAPEYIRIRNTSNGLLNLRRTRWRARPTSTSSAATRCSRRGAS
jgi:hypothetical protein